MRLARWGGGGRRERDGAASDAVPAPLRGGEWDGGAAAFIVREREGRCQHRADDEGSAIEIDDRSEERWAGDRWRRRRKRSTDQDADARFVIIGRGIDKMAQNRSNE